MLGGITYASAAAPVVAQGGRSMAARSAARARRQLGRCRLRCSPRRSASPSKVTTMCRWSSPRAPCGLGRPDRGGARLGGAGGVGFAGAEVVDAVDRRNVDARARGFDEDHQRRGGADRRAVVPRRRVEREGLTRRHRTGGWSMTHCLVDQVAGRTAWCGTARRGRARRRRVAPGCPSRRRARAAAAPHHRPPPPCRRRW